MHRTSLRRKIVLLLLVGILATPWFAVAGPRTESNSADDRPPATHLVFFGRLWSFLERAWSESGCYIDPDGRCMTEPVPNAGTTTRQDEGCYIDPNGRCAS